MTKYAVVTTFNQSGYDKYASRMIDTFLKAWPRGVDLYVYTEDCEITQKANNLHFLAIQSNPESQSFAGFWLLQEGSQE